MPATSIRDLVIHENDLVAGTHGRGFWILDDIAPLRQLTPEAAAAPAHLFAPSAVYRFPRDTNTDTPLPPEEPAGQNPPDGAILYYYLKTAANGPVTLEISDATGKLGPAILEYRCGAAGRSQFECAGLLGASVPAAGVQRGDASVRVGFARGRRRARWTRRRMSDFGDLYGYPVRRRRVDASGNLHGKAYGERAELRANAAGEAGSEVA